MHWGCLQILIPYYASLQQRWLNFLPKTKISSLSELEYGHALSLHRSMQRLEESTIPDCPSFNLLFGHHNIIFIPIETLLFCPHTSITPLKGIRRNGLLQNTPIIQT